MIQERRPPKPVSTVTANEDQVGGERLSISDGFLAPATANVGGHHLVGSTVRDHYFDMVLDVALQRLVMDGLATASSWHSPLLGAELTDRLPGCVDQLTRVASGIPGLAQKTPPDLKVAGAGAVAKKQTRFPFVSAEDNGRRTSQELSVLFPQGLNKDPPHPPHLRGAFAVCLAAGRRPLTLTFSHVGQQGLELIQRRGARHATAIVANFHAQEVQDSGFVHLRVGVSPHPPTGPGLTTRLRRCPKPHLRRGSSVGWKSCACDATQPQLAIRALFGLTP